MPNITAHSEADFIPYVVRCLNLKRHHGHVSFADLREYLEQHFPLNRKDWKKLPSLGCPVWHQRLRNLKSNKTMLLNFIDIREVRNGFAFG
jgi:hypothetical protein